MGRIEKRLERLEEQVVGWGDEDARILDQALARLTTEDLHLLTAYLDRTLEEGGEPTEEEAGALLRLEEMFEEVKNGH